MINHILKNLSLCFTILMLIGCSESKKEILKEATNIAILDSNNDGVINPYEAMDVLFLLQKENNKELTTKDFTRLASAYENEQEEEFSEMFEEFDENKDGKVKLSEVNEDMKGFVEMMDTDSDGSITLQEMMDFDFEDAFLASEEDINIRIEELFNEYGGDDTISLSKVDKDDIDRFSEWDSNHDGDISKKEVYAFMIADNTPISFDVKGNTAFMTGVITAQTPATVLQLLFEYPNVTTIEMITVPGSIDDVANLRASLYVHKFGLITKLNANSSVASGGTDFFLAGKQRIVEKGAKIGVHSWGGGNVAATDVPKDDPVHQKYLDYYEIVGIPAEFYWYTLEAAPANNIHLMTEEEIEIYKVRTERVTKD